MVKQTLFVTLNALVAFAIGFGLWYGVFRTSDIPVVHSIYMGGPLVVLLIMILVMLLVFVIERYLSLYGNAKGKSSVQVFFKKLITLLQNDDYDGALAACDKQRGTTANVLRAGIEKYREIKDDSSINTEKRMQLTQTAIEEANALEGPLLERNLIALSTIASIATMVGLLGTTIGMIRAFAATGNVEGGVIDANQLATGISEALVNTAGGLASGILGIFFYNFFVNKVDAFNYTTDEATFEVLQLLKAKEGK
ncbi:MAG: MotA/TolQ/ExbB proton channel family protein [candidate division Zixibacteria bacterium]|nr:MotA/TolQ/ExbB proton channel family protein [candidate division Zixibacteria bacterium]MDD5426228.1 MotA/TolQ/ExbB proton channel family protein [candidate division Zixibacteria bacterium]